MSASSRVGSSRVAVGLWSLSTLLVLGCGAREGDATAERADDLRHHPHRGTCPGGGAPTLRASSIGLVASVDAEHECHHEASEHADARCLTEPISFVVPPSLEVTRGDAGRGRATLTFRDAATGRLRECEYRGTARRHTPSLRYELTRCDHGARPGATERGDYFRLEVESANPRVGNTEVRVQLGTPDPSIPTEISSADPNLSGARLVVPEGAATPFEHFGLVVEEGSSPGLHLSTGARLTTAIGYGVHVRALERGDGGPLAPSPSGPHFVLTMPYDPAALAATGRTTSDLVVLEVSSVLPWAVPEVLAVRRDLTIDPSAHTVTLQVERAVGFISAAVGGSQRIPYQGGPVMRGHVNVHFLYYGTFTSYQRTVLMDLVRGLSATPWLHILDSYNEPNGQPTTDVVMGQTYDVPSPNLAPADDMGAWVGDAVQAAIDRRQLPDDTNAIYFVVAGNDVTIPQGSPKKNCGWHSLIPSLFTSGRKFGLIKNPNGTPICFAPINVGTTSPNREPSVDSMASIVAHELVETLSDPDASSGWIDSATGVENGDNCAWQWGDTYTAFTVPGPPPRNVQANVHVGIRDYAVQQNWVNIGAGYGYCALRIENDAASVTSFATSLPDPPAGSAYRPMILGATYNAFVLMQNTGDTTWRDDGATGEQYSLGSQSPQDNDFFGVGGRVSTAPRTAPGAGHLYQFSFAPVAMTPGLDYTFQWRMVREAVRWFGESTPAILVRALPNEAALVGSSVPSPVSDDPLTLTVTFRNTSGAAWRYRDGYSVAVDAAGFIGSNRIDLAFVESIEPGETKTFAVTLTAPTAPGDYPVRLQLQQRGVGLFGEVLQGVVHVRPSHRAVFVSQTVPTRYELLSTTEVRATFRNVGTGTWNAGFHLVTGGFFGLSWDPLTEAVAPGATHEFIGRVSASDPGIPLPITTLLRLWLVDDAGKLLAQGDEVLVQIFPATEILARCAGLNLPAQLAPGSTFHVEQTMQNVGGNTWTTAYRLESTPPGDTTWGVQSVPLTQAVGPGESFTFGFDVVAPLNAGSYTYAFIMSQSADPQSYFFDACVRDVEVRAPDCSTTPCGAEFVPPAGNVPNYLWCSSFPLSGAPNQPGTYTVRNTGSVAWGEGTGLRIFARETTTYDGSAVRVYVVDTLRLGAGEQVTPGTSKTFSFCPAALPADARWYMNYQVFARPITGETLFGPESAGTITWIGTKGG